MKVQFNRDTTRPDLILGLMSGTSLDGLDIALVRWEREHPGNFTVPVHRTFQYESDLRSAIRESMSGPAAQICEINFRLGHHWGEQVNRFLEEAGIDASDITCIGSHGQTLWHKSGESTLQVGEPAVMAAVTAIPVVSNFREHDIAAGGTGAPLIPFLDWMLYRELPGDTVAVNVGGIANITCITQNIAGERVTGWDTGPGNIIVNTLMEQLTDGEHTYDAGGEFASTGRVDADLLRRLLADDFVSRTPPKSTGREYYSPDFVARHFAPDSAGSEKAKAGLVATASEWTIAAIAENVRRFWKAPEDIDRIIVSGGGVYNSFFMERFAFYFPHAQVSACSEFGIPCDAKEAIGFALLAKAYLEGIPANLPNVTGAAQSVVMGKFTN